MKYSKPTKEPIETISKAMLRPISLSKIPTIARKVVVVNKIAMLVKMNKPIKINQLGL